MGTKGKRVRIRKVRRSDFITITGFFTCLFIFIGYVLM